MASYDTDVRNALTKALADSSYLRLDCSNDPLTAALTGIGFDTLDPTELVTNGDFSSSSNWDFGGSWSWNASGYAQVTGVVGSSGDLSPSAGSEVPFEIGSFYLLSFECPNMSNSFITPSGGGVTFPDATVTGIYNYVFQATATTDLNFYGELVSGAGKLICRLDNVSVKKIGFLRGYAYLLGAVLSGTLQLASAGGGDIGEDDVGVQRIWLNNQLSGTGTALGGSGLICRYAGGDMFIGNDGVFPGYYVQKTAQTGSTVQDNSEDFTNLYQGDSGYQQIALMYDKEYSASPANGINIGDSTSNPPPFYFGGSGFSTAFMLRWDRANLKFVVGTTHATDGQFLEFALSGADPALRPDTDGLIDLGDATNVLRWRHLYMTGNAQIGGDLDHDGSNVGFYGTAPVAQPAALTAALTQISHTGPTTPDYAIATPVDSGVGSAWGFSTQDEFETTMSVILNLQTRVDELESKLQSLGLLA